MLDINGYRPITLLEFKLLKKHRSIPATSKQKDFFIKEATILTNCGNVTDYKNFNKTLLPARTVYPFPDNCGGLGFRNYEFRFFNSFNIT